MTDKGKPEYGKQYRLTGAGASIANGNTWAESEVLDEAEEARKFLDDHIKVISVPIPKPKEA